jgi:hypothetical protein
LLAATLCLDSPGFSGNRWSSPTLSRRGESRGASFRRSAGLPRPDSPDSRSARARAPRMTRRPQRP